jgi:RNA polymerase sigma factor (sigma-70 family)
VTSRLNEVVQHVRDALLLRDGTGMTDEQLLASFINQRDQAAFAAVVRRHGGMVWGVCRRLLRSCHDAEDAFQATFLVLARRAAAITPRALLANWLYGVAYQTALKARATAARRKLHERQVVEMPDPAAPEQDSWREIRPLLDRELSRLPSKYRAAIVLCDLEGKTRKETARQLGIPEGTLSGRLTRGRTMLAKRLARHGSLISGGALAALLAQDAAAGAPTAVLFSTIEAVSYFATGQAAGVIFRPSRRADERSAQNHAVHKVQNRRRRLFRHRGGRPGRRELDRSTRDLGAKKSRPEGGDGRATWRRNPPGGSAQASRPTRQATCRIGEIYEKR